MASAGALRAEVSASAVARAPTLESVPDAELVERARAGDRWAEEALFRKHVEFIAGLALRLLQNRADAEDVVQDTFIVALGELHRLTDGSSLRSWLAGIAVHKVHRRFRRRRLLSVLGLYHSSHEAMLAAHANTASPEARAELARLGEILATIADADRAAWLLRYVEGYGVADVAELCGCSRTTVKRRIARAHAIVKTHVEIEEVKDD